MPRVEVSGFPPSPGRTTPTSRIPHINAHEPTPTKYCPQTHSHEPHSTYRCPRAHCHKPTPTSQLPQANFHKPTPTCPVSRHEPTYKSQHLRVNSHKADSRPTKSSHGTDPSQTTVAVQSFVSMLLKMPPSLEKPTTHTLT